MQVFKSACMFAAEFHSQIRLADNFTFKGGAVRHRHIHVRDFDFHAAHFNTFLYESFGFFQVIFAIDLH